MGPRKNEDSYLGYKEQGNGQLQSIQSFQRTTNTTERYVKDRQKSSSETVKTKPGRKHVLPCEAENDLAGQCLLMERKFFGLTMADVMNLAYQLAVRNRIKNQFCKRNEKAERKLFEKFPMSSSTNFS